MESIIQDIEKKDGIRMTWNILPIQKQDYSKQPVPLAFLYSPSIECPQIESEPIFCLNSQCRSIFSPYNTVENNTWTCLFCKRRNLTNNIPQIEATTVEYVIKESNITPVFFILLDLCYFDDERQKLAIDAVTTTIKSLPDDCLIGFMTFGTNIELYDLKSKEIRKTYLFSGKREYENLRNKAFSSCFTNKNDSLEFVSELITKRDPFPVLKGYRQIRCTGSALSLAHSISTEFTIVKYLIFTQGPCTLGPGTIASMCLSDGVRSYNDILRGKSIYSKSASEFYLKLGQKIFASGHSVDILSTTLYDVGIYEMRPLTDLTGGIIIMAQDFNYEIYISSCLKNRNTGFGAKIKFLTSNTINFKGVVGQGNKTGNDNNMWALNSMYQSHNITGLFDIKNEAKSDDTGYFQIVTSYQRSDKKIVTRVTTFVRIFSDVKANILSGFDQEAGMVLQARLFTSRKEAEEEIDLIRRIDKLLVRFLKMYASFQPEVPASVSLPASIAYFANFVFFFRRSFLVLVESISPDEGAYHRNLLLRESVLDCMTMIKPTLISFHYQGNIEPVELDAKSLNPDCFLLMDTFHNVMIWRGKHLSAWFKEELHLKEEYKFLNDLNEAIKSNAMEIVRQRLPTPHFTECDEGTSQERILVARVNPSSRNVVLTEDIDFNGFYDCLCKLVVSSG